MIKRARHIDLWNTVRDTSGECGHWGQGSTDGFKTAWSVLSTQYISHAKQASTLSHLSHQAGPSDAFVTSHFLVQKSPHYIESPWMQFLPDHLQDSEDPCSKWWCKRFTSLGRLYTTCVFPSWQRKDDRRNSCYLYIINTFIMWRKRKKTGPLFFIFGSVHNA